MYKKSLQKLNVNPLVSVKRALATVTAQSSSDEKYFIRDKYAKLTRSQVFDLSRRLADDLRINNKILNNEKIAILCPQNYMYAVSMLATWLNGGVALGINKTYPNNVLKYFLNDSTCKLAINVVHSSSPVDQNIVELLKAEQVNHFDVVEDEFFKGAKTVQNEEDLFKRFNLDNDALILYTSGSSGPPKGVVITHRNLKFHYESMMEAWKWTEKDTLLHLLPLNHVHGLINCLLTPLYANARIHMLEKFNARLAWEALLDESADGCTMLQAVPTIYVQLVEEYQKNLHKLYPKETVRRIMRGKIRVCIAGSAPLNQQTYHDWQDITGLKILERYGMTETGMSLTSPLIESPTFKRVPGLVGRPMPGVKVRVVDSHDESKVLMTADTQSNHFASAKSADNVEGNLEVKGDNVFRVYFNKQKQTDESFTEDGWFKTGDTALYLKEHDSFKLLGRTSIDIIKSGGYKISAVDIEREISSHPNIFDVIVFGVKDLKWGEKVCAYIKLKNKDQYKEEEFVKWCKERLPKQSVPRIVKVYETMPRNHIGKVNKKELVKQYEKENPV